MSMFLLLLKSLPALVPFIAEIIKQKSSGGVTDRRAKNPLVPWLVITVFLLLSCLAYGISFMSEHNTIERKLTLENAKLLQDYQREKAETVDLREEKSFLKRQVLEKDASLSTMQATNRELTGQITALDERLKKISEDLSVAIEDARTARVAREELEGRLEKLLENQPKARPPVVVHQSKVSKTALSALETLTTH